MAAAAQTASPAKARKEAAAGKLEIHPEFKPQNSAEFSAAMADPIWRLSNLYWITTKGDDGETDLRVKFKPNRAQRRLINRLWHRNIILKARQLGFTTFVCILWLDYSLFGRGNTRAGIIADTDPNAEIIFRDKVRFSYENLPVELREAMPLKRDSARELQFAHNNSSIRVSTSMRGGTIHYLHISEYGKICARFPHRAREVQTGSIPAVPKSGILVIESTAEGRDGDFYHKSKRAEAMYNAKKRLTVKDYRFHFYAWWEAPEYQMDPRGVIITDEDHEYFDEVEQIVEAERGIPLEINMRQRAWYVATRDSEMSGDEALMWQEYPSFPEEAFQVSTQGTYFYKQLTQARKERRIKERIGLVPGIPCWTFWDIGNSDGTAIWVIQKIGMEFRCIRFYEAWGEPYSHAVTWLQGLGLVFDRHYLPHDADHERQGQRDNKSPRMMLEDLMPGQRFDVVPRIEDVNWGIQQTRDVFPMLYFDETECKPGIIHLENYRRKWSEQQARWSDQPDKTGGHSEAADALRQFAQAWHNGQINIAPPPGKKKKRENNWKTV